MFIDYTVNYFKFKRYHLLSILYFWYFDNSLKKNFVLVTNDKITQLNVIKIL